MNTMFGTLKIPKHCDEAMEELHKSGIWFYDYADYDEEGNIIAYKRCGRGFRKDIGRLEKIDD